MALESEGQSLLGKLSRLSTSPQSVTFRIPLPSKIECEFTTFTAIIWCSEINKLGPCPHRNPYFSVPSLVFDAILVGVVGQIATKCNYLTATTLPQGRRAEFRGHGSAGVRRTLWLGKLRNFHWKKLASHATIIWPESTSTNTSYTEQIKLRNEIKSSLYSLSVGNVTGGITNILSQAL